MLRERDHVRRLVTWVGCMLHGRTHNRAREDMILRKDARNTARNSFEALDRRYCRCCGTGTTFKEGSTTGTTDPFLIRVVSSFAGCWSATFF
jgi:hypothetical protein